MHMLDFLFCGQAPSACERHRKQKSNGELRANGEILKFLDKVSSEPIFCHFTSLT
jgi:hypothetical protein